MNQTDLDNNDISETKNLHIHLALSQAEKEAQAPPPPSMPLPPKTTPVPQPVFMPGMSHQSEEPAAPTPTSTAFPVPEQPRRDPPPDGSKEEQGQNSSSDLPRLRLHIQDIAHEGSSIFLSSVNASTLLPSSIRSIHEHLYPSPSPPTTTTTNSTPHPNTPKPNPPPTRSVTLILRPMDGVAYTTSTDLDQDHKEIHFSLAYISHIPAPRRAQEIAGVVLHELVHCYQWNGRGAAPAGLVEGVADWVRLRCGLAPPHWLPARGRAPDRWDAGYQGTAYFLQYLEARFGGGTVRRLNERLRAQRYDEKAFWTELLGAPVEQLFEDYKKTLPKEEEEEEEDGK
ncbi:BSP-domain-containing protein [Hypoxylon sp. FL0543]|nr:BSP-domain-containing protein [Hypoxylon sp. FL0543]